LTPGCVACKNWLGFGAADLVYTIAKAALLLLKTGNACGLVK
jgi:hypothetical protein